MLPIQPGLRVWQKMANFQLFFQSDRAKDLPAPLYLNAHYTAYSLLMTYIRWHLVSSAPHIALTEMFWHQRVNSVGRDRVRFRSSTCDVIYVLELLTGVWWACWLCPADAEHVRARQNGQWADVMLSVVPSHATHTQPVTPPVTYIVSCHVTSPSSTVLETRLQITTSLLLPGVAAHHSHICVAVSGSLFNCFIHLFLCSLFCDVNSCIFI